MLKILRVNQRDKQQELDKGIPFCAVFKYLNKSDGNFLISYQKACLQVMGVVSFMMTPPHTLG